jgi:FKBP-type peptidyl-prolyl cis-trans isomerase (trigger factor)
MSDYSSITVTKLPKSRVEITGAIRPEAFVKFRAKALRNIGTEVEIPGFRKGMIPEKILVEKVGEHAVYEEVAELALREAYPTILAEHKIDAIGWPEIKITKLAADNPIEFVAVTAVIPEFALPDYKAIANDIYAANDTEIKITQKQIDQAMLEMRQNVARAEKARDVAGAERSVKGTIEEQEKIAEPDLPSIEYLINKMRLKDADQLRVRIKEEMIRVEKLKRDERKRGELVQNLILGFKAELPEVIIESEIDRQVQIFTGEVERAGMRQEDYLKHIGRTSQDFREGFRGVAEQQAKLQLTFDAIASREKIVPLDGVIKETADKIISKHPNEKLDHGRVCDYVFTVLLNEAVWCLLEHRHA